MLTIPKAVVPDQFNVATAFLDRNVAEGRGSKTAIYFEGNSYTYAQIAELANRAGNALLDLGVDLEQRVALLLLDSPQFAAAFFGAIKMGAVPIPLNTALRPNDYVYLLNDSRARVLLVHAALWKQIEQILPELKYVRHIVVVGLQEDGGHETATLHDFEKWTDKASAHLQAAETSKDDSAFWLYRRNIMPNQFLAFTRGISPSQPRNSTLPMVSAITCTSLSRSEQALYTIAGGHWRRTCSR